MLSERLTLVYFMMCVADFFLLHSFIAAMFRRRRGGWKTSLCLIMVVCSAFLENSFALSWLNLIILPFLCFVYVMIGFRISLRNGIIYTLVFYALFAGGEVTCSIWHRFLATAFCLPAVSWMAGDGIPALLFDYFLRFLFLLLIVKYMKKIDVDHSQDITWYLLVTPVVSIFILAVFLYLDFPASLLLQVLLCVGALMLYLFNAVFFMMLEHYLDLVNRLKCEEVYRLKQEMESDNLQNAVKMNESYQCFMHDIHSYLNHLRVLASEGRTQEVVSIINEIEGGIQEETEGIVYSANSILNAILTERSARARSNGIVTDIFVEKFLRLDFLSDADMLPLFGNLLDNALEAAGACEEGRRHVNIKFFMGNPYILILYIENTFVGERKPGRGKMPTTKQHAWQHGLGIGIASKLAEKYGGTLNLEVKDDLFVTTLAIAAYPVS